MITMNPNLRTKFQAAINGLCRMPRVLWREFNEGGLKFQAMSLVYTSLLSLAPFLAVSFSILKAFGVHNQIQPLLVELLSPLRENAGEITNNIISFVDNMQVGVLGFVGFLILFYTTVSALEQLETCLNHIWRVTKSRSLYRRFSDYLSVILIGPVLLFSALGIAASMESTVLVQQLMAIELFGTAYYWAGLILPYVLAIAAFAVAYLFIPNTPVKLVPALIGGVFAGLSWKAAGVVFAIFIVDSARYNAIYPGFAGILLSMLWLYFSWLILLLGGVIAFHVQFPHYLGYESRSPRLSIQSQERLCLLLMYLIGRQHVQGGAACTLQRLADEVDVPWEPVATLLECMRQGGLLVAVEGEVKAYIPARDTDTILLRDIVQAVRTMGDQPAMMVAEQEAGILQALLATLDESAARALQDRSLRDVITAKDGASVLPPRYFQS
jgi:membrane protein